MRIKTIYRNGSRRLLLFFAGWGMDEHPFLNLRFRDYDIALVHDYTDMSLPTIAREYEEIKLMAWSFGVIAADIFMASNPQLPITQSIAVNGTLFPVDDRYGIPEAIFKGTLEGLSDKTLLKFFRRMCGSKEAFDRFLANAPQRPTESLREELKAIAALKASHSRWDMAFVSNLDRIIPPENQTAAWEREKTRTATTDYPHLPDFEEILSRAITDKDLVAQRFESAKQTYDSNARIQRRIAERLSDLWKEYGVRNPKRTIEIGPGTGMFTGQYSKWLRSDCLELWDLTDIPSSLPGKHVVCDAEKEIMNIEDGSVNAIVSASTLQWFDSPRKFIAEAARSLAKDGILAFSSFGPENFKEIREPLYPSLPELTKWLREEGLEIVHEEEDHLRAEFDSTRQMLRHFSATGVNAIGCTDPVGEARNLLSKGIKAVTYHPIIVVARK